MKTLCLCGHARSQHNSPPTANGGRVCDYAGYACDCTGYHRIKPTGRSEAAIRPPLRDGEAQDVMSDTGTTSAMAYCAACDQWRRCRDGLCGSCRDATKLAEQKDEIARLRAERDDARAEIERLRTEVCRLKEALFDLTRERDELRQEKATDAWYTGWQEAVRRMQQAERERDYWHTLADARSAEIVRVMGERDELRALLREVLEWHRCPWKHGASVEVIDLQLHAAWIARIDAALGGRDE